MKDTTKKEIKKIIDEYSYFLGDGDEYSFNMPKVIEELATLFDSQIDRIREEEREEAVREFVKWYNRRFPWTDERNIKDNDITLFNLKSKSGGIK